MQKNGWSQKVVYSSGHGTILKNGKNTQILLIFKKPKNSSISKILKNQKNLFTIKFKTRLRQIYMATTQKLSLEVSHKDV